MTHQNDNTCPDCGVRISRSAAYCRSCAYTRRWAKTRQKLPLPNPSGLCQCGCGGTTPIAQATRKTGDVFGEHTRFISGHHTRKWQRPNTGGALYAVEDRGYTTPCWIWQAEYNGTGYGMKPVGGRKQMAHRWMYERLRGPIPAGLVLDHLCRNTGCVNPDHVEPVTDRENWIRGTSHSAQVARRKGKAHTATPRSSG